MVLAEVADATSTTTTTSAHICSSSSSCLSTKVCPLLSLTAPAAVVSIAVDVCVCRVLPCSPLTRASTPREREGERGRKTEDNFEDCPLMKQTRMARHRHTVPAAPPHNISRPNSNPRLAAFRRCTAVKAKREKARSRILHWVSIKRQGNSVGETTCAAHDAAAAEHGT